MRKVIDVEAGRFLGISDRGMRAKSIAYRTSVGQPERKSTTHHGHDLKPFLIIRSDGVKSNKKDDRCLW